MARRALPVLLLLAGAWCAATSARAAALAPCTRAAARQLVVKEHLALNNPGDPVAQMFCGPFTGRHSRAMVVSLALPSCGVSYGWVVYRSVRGKWRRVLNHNGGAYLTRS